jgi:hypothetical protein
MRLCLLGLKIEGAIEKLRTLCSSSPFENSRIGRSTVGLKILIGSSRVGRF